MQATLNDKDVQIELKDAAIKRLEIEQNSLQEQLNAIREDLCTLQEAATAAGTLIMHQYWLVSIQAGQRDNLLLFASIQQMETRQFL